MRAFDGFVASYDPRLRNPRWVLERITRDSFKGDGDRFNVQFMEDSAIEERFRARLSDYKASGYDKGHLAPAANHKASQQSVEDTFSLTNIAPQVSSRASVALWALKVALAGPDKHTCYARLAKDSTGDHRPHKPKQKVCLCAYHDETSTAWLTSATWQGLLGTV